MEDSTVGGTTVEDGAAANGLGATVRNLNVFDGLALVIALALVGVGFLIGTAGGGKTGATTSAELTVTPDNDTRSLPPGATKAFPLYVTNTNSYGVQVISISAGTSNAIPGGCPAGTVTSAPVDAPVGFIEPGHVRTYVVSVTMSANAGSRCKDQSFTLPLTVTLGSAAADRHFSFGSS
ncbi:MAG: hypothetical protein ACRDRI_08230 [Pseudonocardiaceae bacterium]